MKFEQPDNHDHAYHRGRRAEKKAASPRADPFSGTYYSLPSRFEGSIVPAARLW